jgi:cysteine sulfinate desulfinase/cysteine desulfurase-like protein
MKVRFPMLQDWEFDVDEVSAGVYRVVGTDSAGHRVVSTGEDADATLETCKRQAAQLIGVDDAQLRPG